MDDIVANECHAGLQAKELCSLHLAAKRVLPLPSRGMNQGMVNIGNVNDSSCRQRLTPRSLAWTHGMG